MSNTLAIIFKGETLEGFDLARVRANLGKLFNANDAQLDKLLSGGSVVIKKELNQDGADKFIQVLSKAGAKAYIKDLAQSETTTPATTPAATPTDDSQLGDAPNTVVNLVPGDITELSLAQMQGYLVEPSPADPTPAPEAIIADIAPVGSIIGVEQHDDTPPPQVPDDWRTE